ncbi:hypothetical protein K7X08_002586 [Anisodus acutangulus]|uniref:Uncharacterized protein n=1 Tax=Anisodus acutangulus TaxID=402998 RepID=A0A9Q1LTB6_9SOLA|nr:hypothetical protein K7X08_002586 [Anisodus acutangulus]
MENLVGRLSSGHQDPIGFTKTLPLAQQILMNNRLRPLEVVGRCFEISREAFRTGNKILALVPQWSFSDLGRGTHYIQLRW